MFGKTSLRAAGSLAISLLLFSSAASTQETTPSTAQPKSHRLPVPRKLSYRCDRDITVKVTLRENRARVTFRDKSYAMNQVESGSGVRYAEGHIIWWSKGLTGFLEDETDPKHPVKLAENCQQLSAQSP